MLVHPHRMQDANKRRWRHALTCVDCQMIPRKVTMHTPVLFACETRMRGHPLMGHLHILVERERERCFPSKTHRPQWPCSQTSLVPPSTILRAPPLTPAPTNARFCAVIFPVTCALWFDIRSDRQCVNGAVGEGGSHLLICIGGGVYFTSLREGRQQRQLGFAFCSTDGDKTLKPQIEVG